MFLKKIIKKSFDDKKSYTYYRLVKSYVSDKGPRHIPILNVGPLDQLSNDEIKALSRRLNELIEGSPSLLQFPDHIEMKAHELYDRYLKKVAVQQQNDQVSSLQEQKEHQSVIIDDVEVTDGRSAGMEHLCLSTYHELKLDELLLSCGMTKRDCDIAKLLIIGRAIEPSSELHTLAWGQENSALGDLAGTSYEHLSKNQLYFTLYQLYTYKKVIETYLFERQIELFPSTDAVYLYDLTNTYMEGSARGNTAAQFGHSKERRSDCRLLTLAAVVDRRGFIKYTRFFPGNQSEPATAEQMLAEIETQFEENNKPVIVMDAGIATKGTIQMLKDKKYGYIVVKRNGMKDIDPSQLQFSSIREDEDGTVIISGSKVTVDEEVLLVCKSDAHKQKEKSIYDRLTTVFISEIDALSQRLAEGKLKVKEKIERAIGRIIERNKQVAHLYSIQFGKKDGKPHISAILKSNGTQRQEKLGNYVLRTNMTCWSEQDIWNTYATITTIEKSFRTLKSTMKLRPIYHQLANSSFAHMFVSTLAYHIAHIIEFKVQQYGVSNKELELPKSFEAIKHAMDTQRLVTVVLPTDKETIYLTKVIRPTVQQKRIYAACSVKPPNYKQIQKIDHSHP